YDTLGPRHLAFPALFFLPHTATTEIYTLSLHDALPILAVLRVPAAGRGGRRLCDAAAAHHRAAVLAAAADHRPQGLRGAHRQGRSEEHTSELQSPYDLVCRLLLEKKKQKRTASSAE